MEKPNFAQELKNYASAYPAEVAFKQQMLHLLNEGAHAFTRTRLQGHFTASAWVVDKPKRKALLILHSKIGLWLQPGGHADGNFDLREVAQKELGEETGLWLDSNNCLLFDIDIHTIKAHKEVPEHLHYDARYLFYGDSETLLSINHESKDLRWVDLQEIRLLVGENPSILRMVEKSLNLV